MKKRKEPESPKNPSENPGTSTEEWDAEELRRKAQEAEGAAAPEPEVIPPGIQTPVDDEELILDPMQVRKLAIKVLRSVIYKINKKLHWKELPDEEWADQTIEAAELCYVKYFGGSKATSPLAILIFNLAGGWIGVNVADKIMILAGEEPPAPSSSGATS